MRAVLTLLSLLVCAPMARAHPHIFIETGLVLHVGQQGQLQGVSVVWVYDDLTSLLAIEDLGIDPDLDGVLTPEETAALDRLASEWDGGFDGDLHVTQAGHEAGLSGPLAATGRLIQGRVVFFHRRDLVQPLDAALAPIVLSIYDPTYYSYYQLLPDPALEGPADCALTVEPADTGAAQRLMDAALAALSEDDLMNENNLPFLGAQFADTVRLTCG